MNTPYNLLAPGTPAAPIYRTIKTNGEYYAASGGNSTSYEHRTVYLGDDFGTLPFGKLLADDTLPECLKGHSIDRGVVDDMLLMMTNYGKAPWLQGFTWSRTNNPPAGSPILSVCLAYFNQHIEVRYTYAPLALGTLQTYQSDLTPENLLQGITWALPFWPGMFGVTEPKTAADMMLDLITGGYLPEVVNEDTYKTESCARIKLTHWTLRVLRYALSLPQL